MTHLRFALLALIAVTACYGRVDGTSGGEPGSDQSSGPGWSNLSGGCEPPLEDIPASACDKAGDGSFTGCYYAGASFDDLRLVRNDASIAFDWGRDAPDASLPSDEFSVRWTGRFDFDDGAYVFTARSDDGVRVSVDGVSIIDAWVDQAVTTLAATRELGGGSHLVEVEYYENGGDAVASLSWAKQTTPVDGVVKAFPGAEGFGTETPGGRGGRVIHVTTLADSGPGSFRDAITQSGPRIVVFDISGTIQLETQIGIYGEDKSYLTIAGQTSPGGVQIKGSDSNTDDVGIWFGGGAHDIVVRFMRFRLGGSNPDGVGVYSPDAAHPSYNFVFDHNTSNWTYQDDSLSCGYGYTYNCTLSWNLVAENLLSSMGQCSHREDAAISVHHNVLAHGAGRNPKSCGTGVADFRNNLIYNWAGNNGAQLGDWYWNTPVSVNLINNYWLAGADSGFPYLWFDNAGPVRLDGQAANGGGTKIFMSGNWGPDCPSGCNNDWDNHPWDADYYEYGLWPDPYPVATFERFGSASPFPVPQVATHDAGQLLGVLLPTVGASKPRRDEVDVRVVGEVRSGSGRIAKGYGGPWPDLASGAPALPLDSDQDGMPDTWELAHGLDPTGAADGWATAPNGYTNVENYLNELAGDPVPSW